MAYRTQLTLHHWIYFCTESAKESAPPILWALLNQLLLAAPDDKFDCINLFAVDGVDEHIRSGESSVDDTTCGATNNNPDIEPTWVVVQQPTEREEKMVTRMQEIVQFFLDILQVI
jgi:hypothetical protein